MTALDHIATSIFVIFPFSFYIFLSGKLDSRDTTLAGDTKLKRIVIGSPKKENYQNLFLNIVFFKTIIREEYHNLGNFFGRFCWDHFF